MNKNTFLAGTLAGLLSGASYVSTSVIAKEPRLEPTPTPSPYTRVDEETAKLQEKMRDVCTRCVFYQQQTSVVKLFQSHGWLSEELSQSLEKEIWKSLLPHIRPNSTVIPIELYPIGADTYPWGAYLPSKHGEGTTSYGRPNCESPCPERWLSKILIKGYETVQSKCQKIGTGYETSVRVIGNTTRIKNSITHINIKNDISDKFQAISRAILRIPDSSKWNLEKHDVNYLFRSKPNSIQLITVDGLSFLVYKVS